jgi:hypothetical protein
MPRFGTAQGSADHGHRRTGRGGRGLERLAHRPGRALTLPDRPQHDRHGREIAIRY